AQQADPGPCRPRPGALPDVGSLERLLSVAFQASLLRDEDRAVRFRLFLGEPERLLRQLGPPAGLHRLRFEEPRAFHEQELRRLSQAAKYHRALIGVRRVGPEFEIWGIVQSGPRWLQSARGGRDLPSPVPRDAIVVRADGPGHIAIAVGDVTLAELRGGHMSGGAINVFESAWLRERFGESRLEFIREHEIEVGAAEIPLDMEAIRSVSQQMVKRLISTIVDSHHGGTIVFVPQHRAASVLQESASIQLKYAFAEEEPRRRYRTLILAIMRELVLEATQLNPRPNTVGWDLYQGSQRAEIAVLDEAIMEMSQLIAALADVDGAVVLSERFELLGFGGEIVGSLPEVTTIRRALDLEGTRYEEVAIDGVGTRHRAAYRLCAQEHGAFAVVVSQDGDVQFVAWHHDALMYWKHRNGP
ncbi:MAG: putative sensor domain DACNV-containing protein, partial [Polyangiales bacterium]